MTGYTSDEILHANMNTLSSRKNSQDFYKKLWDTILIDKETWSGVIVDKMKNEKLLDLKTTIFPILDSQNHPIKLVAIQEDITEQNAKEKLFLLQTRQAQMGEMISMIAHQWRQPLGAISATTISLKMAMDLERFDLSTPEGREEEHKYFAEHLDKVEGYVSNLSSTIDDFRNFYKPNKTAVKMTLQALVEKSLKIIATSLKTHDIAVIQEHRSPRELELYDSEMVQVILNILKNAQDAFDERKVAHPSIKIVTENNQISICDNAGGIPEDVLEKIFEVYFSTKTKKNGTGLGLYMSKTIVERHHNGYIEVNSTHGVTCFTITLNAPNRAHLLEE